MIKQYPYGGRIITIEPAKAPNLSSKYFQFSIDGKMSNYLFSNENFARSKAMELIDAENDNDQRSTSRIA